MIAAVIRASLRNRLLVITAALMMASWGWWAVQRAPLDALPDLSDVQVIIKASYPGKAPQVIEDQVTSPLTTLCCLCRAPKPCAVFQCLVTLMCMCCLRMAPISTGRDPGCWNI